MYFALQMPILTADTTKIWTADDYQLLGDDIRYEIINGNLFMTPAPTSFHQIVCENIGFLLSSFVRKYKIGKVLYGPIDVYFGKKNVFQPDVLFVAKENNGIVVPKGIIGAPDLVVEVLSPSNSFSDL
ncbi:MAG: Uma2 family endonuclease, partial [Cytophagales bacterium]|nr:Uma2 family endonuclease [Cytophagales bacterium]